MRRLPLLLLLATLLTPAPACGPTGASNGEGGGGGPPVQTGRTFHVDPSRGSDAAGGLSEATAWRSLDPWSRIEARPGDCLLLRRGGRLRGHVEIAQGGENGHPLVVGAYGEGAPPVLDAGGMDGLHLRGVAHVIVRDLRVTNARFGIFLERCSEVTISGCEVDHCLSSGILFRERGAGNTVERCHVHDVDDDAIRSFVTTAFEIRDNRIHDVTDSARTGGHDAIALHEARGVRSTIAGNLCLGPFTKAGVSLTIGSRASVHGNFITGGARYGILTGNESEALIYDNVIVMPEATDVPGAGIAVGLGSSVEAYNNTIWNGAGGKGERCSFGTAPSGKLVARNNISYLAHPLAVHHWVGQGEAPARVVCDHNLYQPDEVPEGARGRFIYGNLTGRFADWRVAGLDAASIVGDPLFTARGRPAEAGGLRPRAGSPARGAGADLSALFQVDYDGRRRSKWDIGAFVCPP